MLKHRSEQIQIAVKLTDVIVCVIAFLCAYWFRKLPLVINSGDVGSVESNGWLLGAALVTHFLLYPTLGFYQSLRLKSVLDILSMISRALLVDFFVLGSMVFFFQAKATSRSLFFFFIAINYVLLIAEKVGARMLLSSIRRRGYNFRRLLIVGTGQSAIKTFEAFQLHKHWGYIVTGFLSEPGVKEGLSQSPAPGIPLLGQASELEAMTRRYAIDEVYFALDVLDSQKIAREVQLCEKLGIPARIACGMFDLPHSRVTFSLLSGMPVLTYYTTLLTPFQAFVKRLIDICISIVGLVLTMVLYPWISWRIRRESPGPVIFKQVRVGENGRRFKCYKFRTMSLDAEVRKAGLMSANQMQGPMFKIEKDPRVFSFGSFLRRTSLDELPQFFNILRGDMSVVGTRPPTPDEVERYETHFRRRLSIRPGLTGLWQVSGRSKIRSFEDILAMDLAYIDNWSIWLDLRIIFKTIWVMVAGRGAY